MKSTKFAFFLAFNLSLLAANDSVILHIEKNSSIKMSKDEIIQALDNEETIYHAKKHSGKQLGEEANRNYYSFHATAKNIVGNLVNRDGQKVPNRELEVCLKVKDRKIVNKWSYQCKPATTNKNGLFLMPKLEDSKKDSTSSLKVVDVKIEIMIDGSFYSPLYRFDRTVKVNRSKSALKYSVNNPKMSFVIPSSEGEDLLDANQNSATDNELLDIETLDDTSELNF